MTYDNYGNILTKNGKVYVYGDSVWKDKLTSFDGQAITYDAQGNPVTYLGHTLTWEKGRQLKSFDTNSYTYNANGIRTSKIVNGVKHTYTLDGTKILREVWGNNVLVPLYDNEDSVCGIIYNGSAYYFLKNLQGDVVTLVDSWGNLVARYTYDAWGKCTVLNNLGMDISNGIGYPATVNPFRYRGYYLDSETGLYYLQARYYDPITGRFLNADEADVINSSFTKIVDLNLHKYCNNSAPNYSDYTGYIAIAIAGGAVAISFASAAAFIALTTFTFMYLIDRNFRNAINDMIYRIIRGAIDGIGYLSNVISEAVTDARRGRKYWGYEDHHIVAQTDRRAAATRSLITSYGVYTDWSENIVRIKKTLHKHLHTNAYFAAIDIVFRSAVYSRSGWWNRHYTIMATMVFVGILLKSASRLF